MSSLQKCLVEIRAGFQAGIYATNATVFQGVILRLLHEVGWPVFDVRLVTPKEVPVSEAANVALRDADLRTVELVVLVAEGRDTNAQAVIGAAQLEKVGLLVITDGRRWRWVLVSAAPPSTVDAFDRATVAAIDLVNSDLTVAEKVLETYLDRQRVQNLSSVSHARQVIDARRSRTPLAANTPVPPPRMTSLAADRPSQAKPREPSLRQGQRLSNGVNPAFPDLGKSTCPHCATAKERDRKRLFDPQALSQHSRDRHQIPIPSRQAYQSQPAESRPPSADDGQYDNWPAQKKHFEEAASGALCAVPTTSIDYGRFSAAVAGASHAQRNEIRTILLSTARPRRLEIERIKEREGTASERALAGRLIGVYKFVLSELSPKSTAEDISRWVAYLRRFEQRDERTHCWKCQTEFWRREEKRCDSCTGNLCPRCGECLCNWAQWRR